MIFIRLKHLIYLFIIFNFFLVKNSFALETLSYSGRLVQANGSPVTTSPNLKIDLAYTGSTSGTVRCSQNFTSVPLTNGVFHLKLNLNCGAYGTLTDVLSAVPTGESAAIRVTDLSNAKVYSYQAIHSMPFANVAAQLVQLNATDGQVLTWDDDDKKWEPQTVAAVTGGTVTNVSVNSPLTISNPTSTPSIALPQANGSQSGYLSSADWNTFNSKQGSLPTGGTSAHYYRGDNSWQTLDTSVVPENTNLYFTNARALGVPLTDFTTATGAIVATDSVLQAFGKAQGQINTLVTDSSKYLVKNSTDSITGVVNVGTIGLLQLVYTPVGLNDATNKAYVDSEVGTKVSKTGDTMSGVLTLDNDLKIKGGANYVTIKGHATSANYNLVLPQTAGTSGYVLSTDGSGNTSWVTPAVGSSSITDGSIMDADVNASAAIAQSKILNLTTDLAGKQPLISAGTNAQYYRGDKTFVDLGTDVRATALTGFTVGANSAIVATDTTLDAFKKVQGQIDATNTAVAGKEASLTAGSTSQYYRGDKSWQTLDGAVVSNTAAGTIAATNVQSALNELDSEKQDKLTSSSLVSSGVLRFYELPGNGTNYTSLKAPDALGSIINYVLPSVAPTAGQVLSSSAAGVMSWITIPSAPVSTVHGRSGAVVSANGDYSASQITNVPTGTVAATTVQAALDEIASEKEPVLTNPSDITKYYRGDKTWSTFATDAINSVLSTFALDAGAKPAVTNTDTVVGAFGKVQKTLNDINSDYVSKTADQTINGNLKINSLTGFITVPDPVLGKDAANKDYVDGFGQWTKSGTDIYRSGGNVGVGTNSPSAIFNILGNNNGTNPSAPNYSYGLYVENSNTTNGVYGSIGFGNSTRQVAAGILAIHNNATGTYNSGSQATNKDSELQFQTSDSNNSGSISTRMTIKNNGNVGIGTSSPMASSLLELSSTTKGFSPPRMTLAQRNAVTSPTQGLIVFNTTDNTLDYYNGSAWLALNGSPKFIKLVMSAYQNVDTGSIVAFDSVFSSSGMTRSGSGIQLKAGVTYRLEASINTYQAAGSSYLGYAFFNGTTTFGHGAYTSESENVTYGFKSSLLEFYKPSVDEVISVKINDDNIGAGQITPNYNTYLIATELVPSGPAGGGSDNLGNHTVSQNLILGSNWLTGDGGSEGIRIDANGNVGIGTTTPARKLTVQGGASDNLAARFIAGSGMSDSWIEFKDPTTTADYRVMVGSEGDDFKIMSGGTERVRIKSSGNFGIGTASPSTKLDVAGSFRAGGSYAGFADASVITHNSGGSYGQVEILNSNANSDVSYFSLHSAGNTAYQLGILGSSFVISNTSGTAKTYNDIERFTITNAGNVGIGTTNPGYKLDVQGGGVNASSGYTQTSDIRLKTNIELLKSKDALEKITSLRGIFYDWKDQEKFGFDHQIGLVAQDVQKVFPEAVKTNQEGFLSVSYSNLVAPVIESIKELYAQITGIKAKQNIQARQIASLNIRKADDSRVKTLEIENNKLKKDYQAIKQENDAIKAYLCQRDPSATICK